MAFTHILVAVTIMSGAAPGAFVNNTPMEGQAICSAVLSATVSGVIGAYKSNATGIHRDVSTDVEDGWTIVRTGMGRDLGRFRCVDANGAVKPSR